MMSIEDLSTVELTERPHSFPKGIKGSDFTKSCGTLSLSSTTTASPPITPLHALSLSTNSPFSCSIPWSMQEISYFMQC
ncbi:hypothetical protein RJT34_25614 [Clitoria ternatea]|uniref:Uncharacterized protein n=1 Tax=Clitoria ternatea TaxID=43366 RepID=A0AAN9FQ96_CLITE